MIGSTVTISVNGEVLTAPLRPSVIVAFERQYKIGWLTAFSNPDRLEHQLWVAWEALRRHGVGVKPFDEFVNEVDSTPEIAASAKVGSGPLPETR